VKTLDYYGEIIQIPSQCKFVATDENGEVWAFTSKPEVNNDGRWWSDGYTLSDFYYVGDIELPPDVDCKDSLQEIEE
jgi:hypothetical protein